MISIIQKINTLIIIIRLILKRIHKPFQKNNQNTEKLIVIQFGSHQNYFNKKINLLLFVKILTYFQLHIVILNIIKIKKRHILQPYKLDIILLLFQNIFNNQYIKPNLIINNLWKRLKPRKKFKRIKVHVYLVYHVYKVVVYVVQ